MSGLLVLLALAAPLLSLEGAVGLAQAYLGLQAEPYKVELEAEKRPPYWKVRLGGFEIWVEATRGWVVQVRPKPPPPHTREPHLPFAEALRLARLELGQVERLELKPKERLLVWEAKGGGQEVWLEARTGQVVWRE